MILVAPSPSGPLLEGSEKKKNGSGLVQTDSIRFAWGSFPVVVDAMRLSCRPCVCRGTSLIRGTSLRGTSLIPGVPRSYLAHAYMGTSLIRNTGIRCGLVSTPLTSASRLSRGVASCLRVSNPQPQTPSPKPSTPNHYNPKTLTVNHEPLILNSKP